MKRGTRAVLVFLTTILPVVAFAQTTSYSGTSGNVGPSGGTYVPVYDQTTNENLVDYMDNFNDYGEMFESYYEEFRDQMGEKTPDGTTDVLRDLITGSDPGGLAKAACAKGDNQQDTKIAAYAYQSPDGPWATAAASGTGLPLSVPSGVDPNSPSSGPFVQINYSNSLRCLLKEVVEWQKLGLSVQIHSLLKTYIADAQTKQLNNQLKNKVAAANLDWSRGGNAVNDGGVQTTQPVFSTNVSQSQYNTSNRQLEHITDQAAADPAGGNPIGSLGIAAPWRLDVAADMTRNMRGQVEDPFFFGQVASEEKLSPALDPNDFTKFMLNFNDPANKVNGMNTFDAMLSNKANSPLGAMDLATDLAQTRIANQQAITTQKQSNTGFVPATQFDGGNAADPYNLDQQFGIDANPAGQNQQVVTEMSSQGDRQVEQGDTLDAKGGPAAEVQSTELNTGGGVLNYDTTPLATSSTVVNRLVEEMYDSMEYGYFGITRDTTNWAQATMLMIYDELKFNDAEPETVVTNNQNDEPTGY